MLSAIKPRTAEFPALPGSAAKNRQRMAMRDCGALAATPPTPDRSLKQVLFEAPEIVLGAFWSLGPVQALSNLDAQALANVANYPLAGHCVLCGNPHKVRDAETTILISFAFWRGPGRGQNMRENCPKTLFFLGNSMTIKFGFFLRFIVRNVVVIFGGSYKERSKLDGKHSCRCQHLSSFHWENHVFANCP